MKRIYLLAIVIAGTSAASIGLLANQWHLQQGNQANQLNLQQDNFNKYKDYIHTRYANMLDHNFILTTQQMYLRLYNIIDRTLQNDSSAKELSNLNLRLIKDDSQKNKSYHGVPAQLEPKKRAILGSIFTQFDKIPNYTGFIRYTMIVTPSNSCKIYILYPPKAQKALDRTRFRDHPWCFDMGQRQTISDAPQPYYSDSQQQNVGTIVFPCCPLQNNQSNVTSYVAGALGMRNITYQLLFKKYDLDQTQTKFMIFVTYANHTNYLIEPMNTSNPIPQQHSKNPIPQQHSKNPIPQQHSKNPIPQQHSNSNNMTYIYYNFLNKTDDKDLRNSLDKLIHNSTNNNHMTEVHLRTAGNYVVYWADFPTTEDNNGRGYKWYGVLMDKSASTIYDSYNNESNSIRNGFDNGFGNDIVLITLSVAGLGCAVLILWFNHRRIEKEDLQRKGV